MEIFGTTSEQVLNALVEAELVKYCDLTLTIDELEDRAIDAPNKFFGWDPDPDYLIECIYYKRN